MNCKKCGKEMKENEKCSCEFERKGFIKKGFGRMLGVVKQKVLK